MADIFNTNKPKPSAVVPVPEQPLFDMNDIVNAPTMPDAYDIYGSAMGAVDQQKTALDLDAMTQKSELLTTTVKQASEIFKNNEEQTRKITAAQSKRASIEKIPPLVGRIMGLFDKDYDWGYWNEEVRSGKIALAANEQNLSNLQMLSNLQESVINNSISMAQSKYNLISGNFDRALNLRNAIQQESDRRFNQSLQLKQEARAAAGFEMDKIRFAQDQELYTIGSMSDDELGAEAEAGNALAQKEQLQRNTDRTMLSNAILANQKGNLELADLYRSRYLASRTATELTSLAENARDSGGKVAIGGVEFTQRELAKAAAGAATEDQAAKDALTDQIILVAQTANNTNYVMDTALRLQTATGGQGIPPQVNKLLHDTLTSVEAAQNMGNHKRAAETAAAAVTAVDKIKEDMIKAYPEKQRQFVTEVFNDQISTQQSATDFLGDAAFNPSALSNTSKYSTYWRVISGEAKKVAGNISIGPGGTLDIASLSQLSNKGQIMQTAVGNVMEDNLETGQPGVRSLWMGHRNNDAFMQAINDLAQQPLPWMKGIQSLSQFSDPATGSFDTGKFLSYLDDKYFQDVEAGAIPMTKVRRYSSQFLEYMQRPEFQKKLGVQWSPQMPTDKAVFSMISPDQNPLEGYIEFIYQTQQLHDVNYQAEKEQLHNLTNSDRNMLQFRRHFAPQINSRAQDLMKENPNMKASEAQKIAETEIFRQTAAQQQELIRSGNF